mgnify:CR=1 FL=1
MTVSLSRERTVLSFSFSREITQAKSPTSLGHGVHTPLSRDLIIWYPMTKSWSLWQHENRDVNLAYTAERKLQAGLGFPVVLKPKVLILVHFLAFCYNRYRYWAGTKPSISRFDVKQLYVSFMIRGWQVDKMLDRSRKNNETLNTGCPS